MPTLRKWWLLIMTIGLWPVAMGLSGCSSGGGGGLVSIDQSTEIQIGQQAAADLEAQYGVVNDPVQTARIQRIGNRIAAVSQRPDLPWSFKILNIADINALSLPGGPVYVTRGLVNLNIPDVEMANVLGHEIAHINNRDSVHAIQRAMTYQLLSDLVLGGSSQAVQTAANLAVQYALELPRSRADEYAADDVGMKLAYNAGYSPQGMVDFLQRLAQITGPSRSPAWTQTHPLTADRVARAQQEATQISALPRPVPVVAQEANPNEAKDAYDQKLKVSTLVR